MLKSNLYHLTNFLIITDFPRKREYISIALFTGNIFGILGAI